MKLNLTQHTSISGEVKHIQDIKATIEEQRSQVYSLEADIYELQRNVKELNNMIGRNESILQDNYEMI